MNDIEDAAYLTQDEATSGDSSSDEEEENDRPSKRARLEVGVDNALMDSQPLTQTIPRDIVEILSSDEEEEGDEESGVEITSVVSTPRSSAPFSQLCSQTRTTPQTPPASTQNIVEQVIPVVRSQMITPLQPTATECTICTSSLEKSGPHQVCCLNCGHIFGKKCIEKWLTRNKTCPICLKKCFIDQIRLLFVENIAVVDDNEYSKLKESVETMKLQYEDEIRQKNLELDMLKRELQQRPQMEQTFRNRSSPLQRSPVIGTSTSPTTRVNNESFSNSPKLVNTSPLAQQKNSQAYSQMFELIRSVPTKDSRVFDFDLSGEQVITTSKDEDGFKIKQLKLSDISFAGELSIHKDSIRDIKYSPYSSDIVLTVSMDKTAKVTDLRTKTSSQTYGLQSSGWCGCWRVERDSTQFFVGCHQSNELFCYDTRKAGVLLSRHQYTERLSKKSSSLTSLQYVPFSPFSQVSGVLAGSMTGLHFFSAANSFDAYDLVSDVVCVSVSYEKESKTCMATFRKPSRAGLFAEYNGEHCIFSLRNADLEIDIKKSIFDFTNASISKSTLFRSTYTKELYLCGSDESRPNSCCYIWDASTGTKAPLPVPQGKETIYASAKHKEFLGVQTNASLNLYRETAPGI